MRTVVLLLLAGFVSGLCAQTITGVIVGSVTDPSGLAVVGAGVTLTRTNTGVQRKAETNASGDFLFAALEPGAYDVLVEAGGFKKAERTTLNLTANERLSAGTIRLEVGSLTESITVEAVGTAVQTASTERSGVLTTSQVDHMMIRGRNVTSMLQLLPGVVDTSGPDGPNRNFASGLWINGGRRNSVGSWVDGVPTNYSANGWINTLNVSMEAVSEVKVLLNNYQAEYGRMRGAGVQMITKSGTREFHGSFTYFKRHEQFNANNFFNNRNAVGGVAQPKARYRFNTVSYTIGGPVYVPGKFNKERNKLFFFWSQEVWPNKSTSGIRNVTMPTDLEKAGNFSQTVDVNNRLIPVRNPVTQIPFPGNIVPPSQIDPNGQALLKVLPAPNFFDRGVSGGQYNYVAQSPLDRPQRLHTMKIDYNATSSDLISGTWSRQRDIQTGAMDLATPNSNWPMEHRTFDFRGNLASARYQKVLSPTLVNELTVAKSWRKEWEDIPDDQLNKLKRSTVGFKAPQLYPDSNPQDLLPNVTFGGIPNVANMTLTNIPYRMEITTYVITNNLTKSWRNHTFKAGVFWNRPWQASKAVSNRGAFNFATDVNNPLETGYTYANALTGVFRSFAQADKIVPSTARYRSFEWFAQDSWKVTRRLTLELGMRFISAPPPYTDYRAVAFSFGRWDFSKMVQLIQPRMVNGRRMGVDPITGTVYPALAIAMIAPNSGNLTNGLYFNDDPGVPKGMRDGPGLLLSPRVGFAWDVFGNGKTAVRGGVGSFSSSGMMGEGTFGSPSGYPLVNTTTLNYGTLSSLATPQANLLSPSGGTGSQDPTGNATQWSSNFGIQQNIGWGTVWDVSYVGTFNRHLLWSFDMDPIPIGANFDPKNIDPTTNRVYDTRFLRKYRGLNGANLSNWGSSSNYHSLQTTVNRRFARGLQFGTSWTWSKWLDTADYDGDAVSPFFPARARNYGLAVGDRTHNLRVNFLYDVPNTPWNNLFSRWTLHGWKIAGLTGFISGAPLAVGFATTNNADITGTPSEGPRIDVSGVSPVIPKSERTFDRNFRTDVFSLPARGTMGNGGRSYLRGPGINNWDLSIFKNFPIREPLRLEFRCEMYNAFNHTQFTQMNTTARFDATGNQVNPTLGQFTSTSGGALGPMGSQRSMQLAVKLIF